jgi:MerR family mercuric resistance operon transcriptional regulator
MANEMTIGSLAKAAGVNVETIRYYQRLGLIQEPRKPHKGQRQYSGQTIVEMAFVRRAQQLGFTLAEVKELLHLASPASRAGVRRIAENRYLRLSLNVEQLTATRARLKAVLNRSRRYKGRGPDPIITALRGESPRPATRASRRVTARA